MNSSAQSLPAGPAPIRFPRADSVPPEARLAGPMEQTEYLLDGEIRQWSGPRRQVLSPVCLEGPGGVAQIPIGSYPLMTEKVSLEALAAAEKAWNRGSGTWPTLSVAERIRHVEDFAHRMLAVREEVVRLLQWEIGKTLRDSQREFDRTIEYIRGTIEALKDLDRTSSRFVIEEGIIAQIRRAPLGVVLCMGPYNYPLNETFTTLIPALIMGNTVVFKTPKLGVLLYRPLLTAFRDSFPRGVVNTIYGDGQEIVGPLMSSGRIDVLGFIGSSRVGDLLTKQHPRPHRLRRILGLDAKNPAVILPDADLDLAARECVLGALSFNGQRCTALKLIFVHSSVAEPFLERFAREVESLRPGLPWEEGVALTPLPEPGKGEYLASLVEDAMNLGARVVNRDGGTRDQTYFHPAVLFPVDPRMRVYHEEQFGPVVPVLPYKDIEEVVRFITDSNFGQQVSLFGSDANRLARLIDPLVNQVCRVNLNSQCQRGPDTFPFTGRKDSAEGTLSMSDALRVFSIRTLVAAKGEEENKRILRKIVEERSSSFLSNDYIL